MCSSDLSVAENSKCIKEKEMALLEIIGALAVLAGCYGAGIWSAVKYIQAKHPQIWAALKQAEVKDAQSTSEIGE